MKIGRKRTFVCGLLFPSFFQKVKTFAVLLILQSQLRSTDSSGHDVRVIGSSPMSGSTLSREPP